MIIINEKTTLVVALGFTDQDADPVIPSAAEYRLDDLAAGTQILDWTAFSPAAATHDLIITDAQNAILNAALESERKRLTVKATFGADSKKATAEYIYAVRNLSKIS